MSCSYPPTQYKFTLAQFDKIMNRTIELRNKYSVEPLSLDPVARDLTRTLDNYILDNQAERDTLTTLYLDHFLESYLRVKDCNGTSGVEYDVCTFIGDKNNHQLLTSDEFPESFPRYAWLKVRSLYIIFIQYSLRAQQFDFLVQSL